MSCSLCGRHRVHVLLTTKTKCYKLFCPGAGLLLVGKPAVTLACKLQQLVRGASIGPPANPRGVPWGFQLPESPLCSQRACCFQPWLRGDHKLRERPSGDNDVGRRWWLVSSLGKRRENYMESRRETILGDGRKHWHQMEPVSPQGLLIYQPAYQLPDGTSCFRSLFARGWATAAR